MSNQATAFSLDEFSIEGLIAEFNPTAEIAIARPIIDLPSPSAVETPQPITAQISNTIPPSPPLNIAEPEENAFDIANDIEFDVKFRGYDRLQVDDYIDKLTLDYNAVCEKNASLVTENEGLRLTLSELYKLRV